MEYREPARKERELFDAAFERIHAEHELFFEKFGKLLAEELGLFTAVASFSGKRAGGARPARTEGFGLEEVMKEPEFEDTDLASKFAEMVERMEKNIDALSSFDSTQIFIGRESPIPDSQEFSIVISRVHFANRKDGILALLGPKRMDYNKNVDIINSLNKNVRKKRTGKKGK